MQEQELIVVQHASSENALSIADSRGQSGGEQLPNMSGSGGVQHVNETGNNSSEERNEDRDDHEVQSTDSSMIKLYNEPEVLLNTELVLNTGHTESHAEEQLLLRPTNLRLSEKRAEIHFDEDTMASASNPRTTSKRRRRRSRSKSITPSSGDHGAVEMQEMKTSTTKEYIAVSVNGSDDLSDDITQPSGDPFTWNNEMVWTWFVETIGLKEIGDKISFDGAHLLTKVTEDTLVQFGLTRTQAELVYHEINNLTLNSRGYSDYVRKGHEVNYGKDPWYWSHAEVIQWFRNMDCRDLMAHARCHKPQLDGAMLLMVPDFIRARRKNFYLHECLDRMREQSKAYQAFILDDIEQKEGDPFDLINKYAGYLTANLITTYWFRECAPQQVKPDVLLPPRSLQVAEKPKLPKQLNYCMECVELVQFFKLACEHKLCHRCLGVVLQNAANDLHLAGCPVCLRTNTNFTIHVAAVRYGRAEVDKWCKFRPLLDITVRYMPMQHRAYLAMVRRLSVPPPVQEVPEATYDYTIPVSSQYTITKRKIGEVSGTEVPEGEEEKRSQLEDGNDGHLQPPFNPNYAPEHSVSPIRRYFDYKDSEAGKMYNKFRVMRTPSPTLPPKSIASSLPTGVTAHNLKMFGIPEDEEEIDDAVINEMPRQVRMWHDYKNMFLNHHDDFVHLAVDLCELIITDDDWDCQFGSEYCIFHDISRDEILYRDFVYHDEVRQWVRRSCGTRIDLDVIAHTNKGDDPLTEYEPSRYVVYSRYKELAIFKRRACDVYTSHVRSDLLLQESSEVNTPKRVVYHDEIVYYYGVISMGMRAFLLEKVVDNKRFYAIHADTEDLLGLVATYMNTIKIKDQHIAAQTEFDMNNIVWMYHKQPRFYKFIFQRVLKRRGEAFSAMYQFWNHLYDLYYWICYKTRNSIPIKLILGIFVMFLIIFFLKWIFVTLFGWIDHEVGTHIHNELVKYFNYVAITLGLILIGLYGVWQFTPSNNVPYREHHTCLVGWSQVWTPYADNPVKDGTVLKHVVQPHVAIERRAIRAIGPYFPTMITHVQNTAHNALNSVLFRQCRDRCLPFDEMEWRSFVTYVNCNVGHIADQIENRVIDHVDWLKAMCKKWPSAKAKIYRREVQNWKDDGYPMCGQLPRKERYRVNSFVKREAVLNAGPVSKSGRCITSRGEAFNVRISWVFHEAKKWVLKCQSENPDAVTRYTIGMNVDEMGDLFRHTYAGLVDQCAYDEHVVLFETDYSTYDASQGSRVFIVLNTLYQHIYHNCPDIIQRLDDYFDILKKPKDTYFRNYAEGSSFRVLAPASRGSGEPDTTMSNTMFNEYLLRYTFHRVFGTLLFTRIFVIGDDGLVMVRCKRNTDLDAVKVDIENRMERLNIKIKLSHTTDLHGTCYNCKYICRTLEGATLVSSPYRFLSRAPLIDRNILKWPEHIQYAYCADKLQSIAQECICFPRMKSYYMKYARIMRDKSKNMKDDWDGVLTDKMKDYYLTRSWRYDEEKATRHTSIAYTAQDLAKGLNRHSREHVSINDVEALDQMFVNRPMLSHKMEVPWFRNIEDDEPTQEDREAFYECPAIYSRHIDLRDLKKTAPNLEIRELTGEK